VDCHCVNKKAIESLIRCGALDSTGATRRGMLEVLPAAQAAGAKFQQDAQLGQGSIFDLEQPSAAAQATPAHQDLPVPPLPDERKELNLMEKETLGLFLSSHPLKEVRAALRAKVDCSLPELDARKDGEWVTVGGMVAEAKKIRTRKGDPMMFCTLDDLEGQVEMIVFNSALTEHEAKLDGDSVVIVRGRVDKKEANEVKLVAHDVEVFEPSPEEVEQAAARAAVAAAPRRLTLHVAPEVPDSFIDELREVVTTCPGERELVLRVGARTLVLGPRFKVSGDGACRSLLDSLPGASRLVA